MTTTPSVSRAPGPGAGEDTPSLQLIASQLTLLSGLVQDLQREVREVLAQRPEPVPEREWLLAGEMAEVLDVPPRTLQSWVRRGRLPADCIKQVQRGSRTDRLFHVERTRAALRSGAVYGSPAAG